MPPLTAVENLRTVPVRRVVFTYAKIVYVLDGSARVSTEAGSFRLTPGSVLALGAGRWCSIRPTPKIRTWTLYVDEQFLRSQLTWLLPDRRRVRPGYHPSEWDGSALISKPGIEALRASESLWRQISALEFCKEPERDSARLVMLFMQHVELTLPSVVSSTTASGPGSRFPVRGTMAYRAQSEHVSKATVLLASRMSEPWTVDSLADAVVISRAHLARLFIAEVGLAPMRFLAEVRLTEFTRLLEETHLAVGAAARLVGWNDARIAAKWFRRRYGVSPSKFRRYPHPTSPPAASVQTD